MRLAGGEEREAWGLREVHIAGSGTIIGISPVTMASLRPAIKLEVSFSFPPFYPQMYSVYSRTALDTGESLECQPESCPQLPLR